MYIDETEEVINPTAYVKLNPVDGRMLNFVISGFIHPLRVIFLRGRFDFVEDDSIIYQVYEPF